MLTRSSYFTSMAVAKTHSMTFVTGVIKNLFGLLPKKDKLFYHPNINEVIVDLTRLVTPNLCVVDAIVGLEGIVQGRTRRVNALIVGRKPVSVDATMARIMGFEPERIRHLEMAEKYGLGSLRPKVLGESLESMTMRFQSPANLRTTALVN